MNMETLGQEQIAPVEFRYIFNVPVNGFLLYGGKSPRCPLFRTGCPLGFLCCLVGRNFKWRNYKHEDSFQANIYDWSMFYLSLNADTYIGIHRIIFCLS